MATRRASEIIQHVRRGVLLRDGAGLSDGQLLEDYISRREEASLAALVRRQVPPGKDADKPKTDQERLQGTWEWVSWTQGGTTIKRGDLREADGRPKTLRFIGDKVLTVMVNSGGKEVEFRYRCKLDPSRKPKEIDLTPEGEPRGRTGPGIYELEGDTLRVCFPAQPGQDRPPRLESKQGEGYLLLTYNRAAK
jgi:uncharacterized protein (TIGR03067 family)